MTMEVECSVDSKEKDGEAKRVRRRRKKIYQAIRQQMEFYFSDANLTKDRFLTKMTKQDPYVDLRVFLGFNKIRALTNSVEELANALSNSELLSLSEDRTKVARLTPVERNISEDECSIYVEGLPPDAKHEWLQEVFSVYGKVVYVSIPKYRQSGKIKGFAFVEFESAETANKALEAFQGAGCCLPTDMAPEQLCSVTTFEPGEGKWQVGIVETQAPSGAEEGENGCRREEGGEEEVGRDEADGAEGTKVQHHSSSENISPSTREKRKKRQRRSDGTEEGAENDEDADVKLENVESEKSSSPVTKKKKKKHKREEEDEEVQTEDGSGKTPAEVAREEGDSVTTQEKKKRKRKRDNSDDEEAVEEVVEEEEVESIGVTEGQKKRKRKKDEEFEDQDEETERKKSQSEGGQVETEGADEEEVGEEGVKRKRKKRNRNKREKLEGEPLGLRILSKRDWKRLRNKYLQLQRKNMQMLRSQMMGKRWCNYWGGEGEDNGSEQQHHGGDMEQGEEPHEAAPKEKEDKGKSRVKFLPGVIVKILFKEPLEAARKFKDEVKNLPKSDSVAYVDVKDAASAAYVRCHSADAAKDLIKDIPWEDRSILEGGEEKEYWDKIMKDRAEKIDKKIRVNQRGRDKILRKAENLMGKHLRYDN